MNLDSIARNTPEVGQRILTYLVEHPEAQDTLEGILEWWLLGSAIQFETAKVKEALSELGSKGFILAKKGLDSQTRYQINQAKYQKILELLNQKIE